MKPFYLARRCASVLILFAPAWAQAARPMVADDASILDAGHCQLESWMQFAHGQDEYWAVPACRAGGWELAAGVAQLRPGAAGQPTHGGLLQAKTVFRGLSKNSWGVGLTLADQFSHGDGLAGNLSANVPFSVSLHDDLVIVHANAGWLRERAAHRSGATWALGAELNVAARAALTFETYGSARGHDYLQAGARYALIPGRLDLDAAIGERAGWGGADHYFALGLTWSGAILH